MSKHTPGPWRVRDYPASGPVLQAKWIFAQDLFTKVGEACGGTDENWNANALLMAAAPVMRDALESIASLTDSLMGMDLPHNYLAHIRAINLDAKDALAKAEGK